jgi:hypothetical protein
MKILFIVSLFLFISPLTYSTIINIPEDYSTIQAGIDASVDGDTVLVQPGTYFENLNYDGKNIVVGSLYIITQDTTCISQTIIDGNNNNGRLVTFENEETDEAKLIGFTIKNGYGEYFYREDAVGVGIYIINSSPCIENNIIEDNNCGMYQNGGGIGIQNSSAKIKNNIIRNNDGAYYGGGIYVYQSEGVLIENNMIYNHITQSGFGVAYGAGICINQSNNIIVINNMIYNNTVDFGGGGGVAFLESSSDLINVTIRGNSATHYGGIYCYSSNLSLTNVTITGNDGIYGGGIYCSHSSPSLQNVTISGNLSSSGGGIYCNWDSNPTLMNCILWNNSPEEIYFSSYDAPNSITMSYSDIQGGEDEIVTNNNGTVNWLEGNIDEDPLFVGTGEHPYSLLEDSPCIDAGIPDTTGLNLPPWDIIGNLRIWDGDGDGEAIIDMGAYEYGAPPYVNVDENVIVQTPEVFLHQNYPNPFNPETTISFNVSRKDAKIEIYNIKGQKVKTLPIVTPSPYHTLSVTWNGRDYNGNKVSSGIYFYKLIVNGNTSAIKKCLLLK